MKHVTRALAVTFSLMALCCLVALGGARAGWISPTDDFPVKDGQYKSENGTGFEPVDGDPVPNNVAIASMRVVSSPTGPVYPPPLVGHEYTVDAHFDVFVEMYTCCNPWSPTGMDNWTVGITNTSRQSTDNPQQFEIELLSIGGTQGGLSFVGPDDISVTLRESPTSRSLGGHSITSLPDRNFEIDGSFDVSLEVSVDGGRFHPASNAVHMGFSIIPEPATLSLLCIGGLGVSCFGGWAMLRRRRESRTAV